MSKKKIPVEVVPERDTFYDSENAENTARHYGEAAVSPEPAPAPAPQLGTVADPIGKRDPSHLIFWHGRDINGREFIGSAASGMHANRDATALGSATCHLSINPDYVEPDAVPVAPAAASVKEAKEQNAFYVAGFEDGQNHLDSQYHDLKALVQAWATEQAMNGADLDQVPMVVYIRHRA